MSSARRQCHFLVNLSPEILGVIRMVDVPFSMPRKIQGVKGPKTEMLWA